jgi:hypothetical protein
MPGAFTNYAARLVQPGAVQYDDGDQPKAVSDVYGVTLPYGVRPVLSAISGLPAAGAQHPSYPGLIRGDMTIRNAVEQAGSLVWMVEVAYAPQGDGGTSVTNPDDDPTQPGVESAVRITGREWPIYEVQTDFVADCDTGDPVLNSAGDPYDRVPQLTRRYMGARVKRAEQNWPKLAASLDGTINKNAVTVLGVAFAAHTARLEITIEDTLAVGSDTRYVVTYDFVPCHNIYKDGNAIKDAGYDIPLVETGFSYRDSTTGELVRATVPDSSGADTPTALPVLLDENGELLSEGSDPVVSVWRTYPEEDWSDLELPAAPTDGDPEPPEPDDPDSQTPSTP